jgi:hypothetical protein
VEFFGRIFLGGIQQKVILILKELICQDFGFCQDFFPKERREGRRMKIEISRSAIASSSHLKTTNICTSENCFAQYLFIELKL